MTSDPTQLAPARFYGFARTRTAAENFSALTPPSNDATSIIAPSKTQLIPSAAPTDATSIGVLSEAEPSRRADAISIVTPSQAQSNRKTKSRSRKKSRSKRNTSRTRRAKAKAAREPKKLLSRLELHQAHCGICGDELQEEIDERFVNWECVSQIADDYELNRSALYRHAHATGLFARRDRNIRRALAHIIHEADRVQVTADAVVRAVKIFAHINARGEWVNPPARVVFSSTAARPPKPTSVDAELSGTPSHLISSLKP